MTREEQLTAELLAMRAAFAILVRALEAKGVISASEIRQTLTERGGKRVLDALTPFSDAVGREMAELAKDI